MKAYHDLVEHVLDHGVRKTNRTGTDTLSSFAQFYRVDLSDGFPLLTTKKVFFRSVVLELLWYLRGEDHIRWLRDENDCHIWDAWADQDGHVGPIYPVLWRRFPAAAGYPEASSPVNGSQGRKSPDEGQISDSTDGERSGDLSGGDLSGKSSGPGGSAEIDQLGRAIEMLKTNPDSRRIVVSAWHPGLLPHMALPPCHIMYIFNVAGGKLNCHLTQRSGDIALGIPFNLACYSALTMAVAREVGLEPGEFAHTIVDAHIYVNHIDGLREQLKREPRPLPKLEIAQKPIDELTYGDFKLHDYNPHPSIKFEVAV